MVTVSGIVDLVARDWEWLFLGLASLWFLRWYSLAEVNEPFGSYHEGPVRVAIRGMVAGLRANLRGLAMIGAFIAGGFVLAANVLGFTTQLLISLDPAAWGAVVAAAVSGLQVGNPALSFPVAAGLVIGTPLGLYLLRGIVRARS